MPRTTPDSVNRSCYSVEIRDPFYRRLAVFALGVFSICLIVFVFRITDRRLPTILALSLACALAAYMILPRIVQSASAQSWCALEAELSPIFGDGLKDQAAAVWV